MNWIDEVRIKMKKKNQVLFTKDSEYLQDLIMLFQNQNHRVMTLWAFDFAAESIPGLNTYIVMRVNGQILCFGDRKYQRAEWKINIMRSF